MTLSAGRKSIIYALLRISPRLKVMAMRTHELMAAYQNKFMYAFLNVCALVILKQARFVGYAYTKWWGRFGLVWFDHRFDWLLGPEYWVWNERGVYGGKLIRQGDKVLDICCGDGIYAGLYYSRFAGVVHAIDRDQAALNLARKRYSRRNVKFLKVDVTKEDFPLEKYDAIFMFAAIEHLSVECGTKVLRRITTALSSSSNGAFLGSTPIYKEATGHGHPEHVNEFTSVEQLRNFLAPHFAEIEIWSSKWELTGERKDTYFHCRNPIVNDDRI